MIGGVLILKLVIALGHVISSYSNNMNNSCSIITVGTLIVLSIVVEEGATREEAAGLVQP